jgi:two-component system OmpR family response regulator
MPRILVADNAELAAALEASGHAVVAHPGIGVDLAVVSGVGAMAAFRGTPVIVLTPPGDVIAAFAAGADDVVPMPASPAEVVARVGAILRRTTYTPPVGESVLRYADVVLDEARFEVRRADLPIELTATEFNLLRFFLQNPRRVLSKRQILQAVWPATADRRSNVVETYVAYLRRKLDVAGPPLIRTVRRIGYILD